MNTSLVVSTFHYQFNGVGLNDYANSSCLVVNDSGVYLPVSSMDPRENNCVNTMILIVTSLHRRRRRVSGRGHPMPIQHPTTEAC